MGEVGGGTVTPMGDTVQVCLMSTSGSWYYSYKYCHYPGPEHSGPRLPASGLDCVPKHILDVSHFYNGVAACTCFTSATPGPQNTPTAGISEPL